MFESYSNDVEEMAGRNNNFGKADAKEVPNSTDNLSALNKSKNLKSEMFFFSWSYLQNSFIPLSCAYSFL